jgi:hypothetical protein
MKYEALVLVLLAGCAAVHGFQSAKHTESINVFGAVEKICAGCDIADFTNGGAVAWDVVTVRLISPEALSGTTIAVKVLLEGDGVAQRKVYSPSSHITFVAAEAAIDARQVTLQLSDIKGAD